MPGVKRMGINAAIKFLDPLIKIGLKSVLLFAVTAAEKVGTQELRHYRDGPVLASLGREARRKFHATQGPSFQKMDHGLREISSFGPSLYVYERLQKY